VNDKYLYIIESDDLIAAWVFQHRNRRNRSYDFSRVPTEYRYSAPPSDSDALMPCHVQLKPGNKNPLDSSFTISYSSTIACHQSAFPQQRPIVSISELEAVDFSKRNVAPYISPVMDSYVLGCQRSFKNEPFSVVRIEPHLFIC
jgi:hypothetical protein